MLCIIIMLCIILTIPCDTLRFLSQHRAGASGLSSHVTRTANHKRPRDTYTCTRLRSRTCTKWDQNSLCWSFLTTGCAVISSSNFSQYFLRKSHQNWFKLQYYIFICYRVTHILRFCLSNLRGNVRKWANLLCPLVECYMIVHLWEFVI